MNFIRVRMCARSRLGTWPLVRHRADDPGPCRPRRRHRRRARCRSVLYHNYCSVCHGDKGDGRSRATGSLSTVPRDFTTRPIRGASSAANASPRPSRTAGPARPWWLWKTQLSRPTSNDWPSTCTTPSCRARRPASGRSPAPGPRWAGSRYRFHPHAGRHDGRPPQRPEGRPKRGGAFIWPIAPPATARAATAPGRARTSSTPSRAISSSRPRASATTVWPCLRRCRRRRSAARCRPGSRWPRRSRWPMSRSTCSSPSSRPRPWWPARRRRRRALTMAWRELAGVALGAAVLLGGWDTAEARRRGPDLPRPRPPPHLPSPSAAQHELGRKVYNFRCYFCHGYSGDAKTLAASYLSPLPRDFSAASPQQLPGSAILAAVRDGRAGTAMKSVPAASSTRPRCRPWRPSWPRSSCATRRRNTAYHTPENGWPEHGRFAAAFPFARGEIALDDRSSGSATSSAPAAGCSSPAASAATTARVWPTKARPGVRARCRTRAWVSSPASPTRRRWTRSPAPASTPSTRWCPGGWADGARARREAVPGQLQRSAMVATAPARTGSASSWSPRRAT
jgi:mono/diheme cytochrome c family protein